MGKHRRRWPGRSEISKGGAEQIEATHSDRLSVGGVGNHHSLAAVLALRARVAVLRKRISSAKAERGKKKHTKVDMRATTLSESE